MARDLSTTCFQPPSSTQGQGIASSSHLGTSLQSIPGVPSPFAPLAESSGELWEWGSAGNVALSVPHRTSPPSPSGVQADRIEVTIDGYPYMASHSHRGAFWQTDSIVNSLESAITSGARAIRGVDVIQDGSAIKIMNLGGATLESARLYRDSTGVPVDIPVYPSEHKILISDVSGQSGMPSTGGFGGGVPRATPSYGASYGDSATSSMTFNVPRSTTDAPQSLSFKVGDSEVNITFASGQDLVRLFDGLNLKASVNSTNAVTLEVNRGLPFSDGAMRFASPSERITVTDGDSGNMASYSSPSSVTIPDRWPLGAWDGRTAEKIGVSILVRKEGILYETIEAFVDRNVTTDPSRLVAALNAEFAKDSNGILAALGRSGAITLTSPDGFSFQDVSITSSLGAGSGRTSILSAAVAQGTPGSVQTVDTSYRDIQEPLLSGSGGYSYGAYNPSAARPSTATFDLMAGSQTLSGGTGRGGGQGEMSMVTLWFKVGEETVVVQDTFSTLKEIQAAINDAIHKNPRVENTLAHVEGGKLVVKNAAADDFSLAHWSTAPASTTSLTLNNRVDGSVASAASPSTVVLDIGQYVDNALSLTIDFVHDAQQSPGVLNIQAQEGRTMAELASLVSTAGASHGVTAEVRSIGGQEKLVLKDLRGRDFDATDMQVLAQTETDVIEGEAQICTPSSSPPPSGIGGNAIGGMQPPGGGTSIPSGGSPQGRYQDTHSRPFSDEVEREHRFAMDIIPPGQSTAVGNPLPPQSVYPQGDFKWGNPFPNQIPGYTNLTDEGLAFSNVSNFVSNTPFDHTSELL